LRIADLATVAEQAIVAHHVAWSVGDTCLLAATVNCAGDTIIEVEGNSRCTSADRVASFAAVARQTVVTVWCGATYAGSGGAGVSGGTGISVVAGIGVVGV